MPSRTSLHRPSTPLPHALPGTRSPLHGGQETAIDAAQAVLALPFEVMRQYYAGAVNAGVMPRSLLASARLERWLGALEVLTLGPFARRR